ncbi:MAG: DUF763 domain-containing protein [Candidatus Diapherotrites archaeon]|nr:DUF763 domain-containing protein [Candidatus Diapherotrites archaeon]
MNMRYAELPLHYGKAPYWLFRRMVALGKAISEVVILEYGTKGFLERIADPFWFQALSCVLGFDWHSSGTTTTTCGALKEALNESCEQYGLAIAGGKGKASKKAPEHIEIFSERLNISDKKACEIVYASRMSAKVDNAALQDCYQLYHHCIFFDEKGNWVVVQQGMNDETSYARRYHWNGNELNDFVEEPHKAICCDEKRNAVLNLTSKRSRENKKVAIDLVKESPEKLKKEFMRLGSAQRTLENWNQRIRNESLVMPKNINWNALKHAYEFQPKNYEEFLSIKGIGPGTVRALALISELIYGSKADWRDPVKYSFAVGGKDGVPFPVKKRVMDKAIEVLSDAVKQAKLSDYEKLQAIKRLKALVPD